MWCAGCRRRRYLAVNIGVRRYSADSGVVRSPRVPNPSPLSKCRPPPLHYGTAASFEAVLLSLKRLIGGTGEAPAHHGRLDSASGFVVAPRAIDETAGERQLIGAAVILAQNLHRLIRRRVALAIELCETPFARCHSTSLHDGRL